MTRDGQLARQLGTADPVTIGLGSMVGGGVFSAFAPAAAATVAAARAANLGGLSALASGGGNGSCRRPTTLPAAFTLAGIGMFAVGIAGRALARRPLIHPRTREQR